ncbi:MAG: hypothetical protein WD749_07070 [Phycisphaerales bacterium]
MMTLSTTVLENGRTITLVCHACYAASRELCLAVYGRDHRRGGIDATNSMVHEVTNLIEQVAGC